MATMDRNGLKFVACPICLICDLFSFQAEEVSVRRGQGVLLHCHLIGSVQLAWKISIM